MASSLKGGKTSPRFLRDLEYYNPQTLADTDDNVLTQLPPRFDRNKAPSRRYKRNACAHSWALKTSQSRLDDPRSTEVNERWMVSMCCAKCCCHASLELDIGDEPVSWPCKGYHHFLHLPQYSPGFRQNQDSAGPAWVDEQQFRCSSCQANLSVQTQSARLQPNHVELLINRSLINNRAQTAIAADPHRMEGVAVPTPLIVMNNLRAYLQDSMRLPTARQIHHNTKKWLVCLGEPCSALLNYLGFERQESGWLPPKPPAQAAQPYTDQLCIFLDDVITELNILMEQQPESERRQGQFLINNLPAKDILDAKMNAQGYRKNPLVRALASYDNEHPLYAGLGAVMDMHDELLVDAYRRQLSVDMPNQPYYFDCLEGIAQGRQSEELQTAVLLEVSSGVVGTTEIQSAYRAFGLSPEGVHDEDTLIGHFEARVLDAPGQEAELRKSLKIIGRYSQMEKVTEFAENSVSTYEQAMSWLCAAEDWSDDVIIAVAGSKMGDTPKSKEKAQRAIDLIAKHRNSSLLRSFTFDDMEDPQTVLAAAYSKLGVDARSDDDFIMSAFITRRSDNPAESNSFEQALEAIARQRNSAVLLEHFGRLPTAQEDLSTRPVGLLNRGNYCYLNSILQTYFSLKPLREFVLSWERYKKEIGVSDRPRIGGRAVTDPEIRLGQTLTADLCNLFARMIAAPTPFIDYETNLARLALMPYEDLLESTSDQKAEVPPNENDLHPMSEKIDTHVSEDDANSTASMEVVADLDEISQRPQSRAASNASTLVDVDLMEFGKDELSSTHHIPESSATDLDGDRSIINVGNNTGPVKLTTEQDWNDSSGNPLTTSAVDAIQAPNRPPPVPPRPNQTTASWKGAKEKVEEWVKQQDVGEAVEKILDKVRLAIDANNTNEGGPLEQRDLITELFFGTEVITVLKADGTSAKQSQPFYSVRVPVSATFEDALEISQGIVGGQDNSREEFRHWVQVPPILQFEIQRVQWDNIANKAVKDESNVALPPEIFLDRFLESADSSLLEARQNVARVRLLAETNRERIAQIQGNGGKSGSLTMERAARYLESISEIIEDDELDGTLAEDLKRFASIESAESKELQDMGEKVSQDLAAAREAENRLDPQKKRYVLHSVFFHRGMSGSGHYWVCIRDFKNDVWRKYNDAYVTEVTDPKDIFQTSDGPGGLKNTPYFGTYIDARLVDQVVDPLCRVMPEERPEDENMTGADAQIIEGQPMELDNAKEGPA